MRPALPVAAAIAVQALVAIATAGPAPAGPGPEALVYVLPQPSAPPAAHVDVVGLGFEPGQAIEIRWDAPDGPQLAGAAGPDFTADVTVPAAGAGLHTLVVLSRDANGVMGTASTTGFLVTGPGAPASASATSSDASAQAPTSAVPKAGPTPASVWAMVVLSLFALAVVLVLTRRRQRRSGPSSRVIAAEP